MATLALSMIVKNEEKDLPECLSSVKNVVDEIVVVDTGSTDNTVDIAKQYGAKVFHFEWVNDFAAARNYALKNTKSDWVLYLDADERLDPSSIPELKSILSLHENAGIYCNVISRDHQNNHPNIIKYTRLFRNSPIIQFEGAVHEQIIYSLKRNNYTEYTSGIKINHIGYDVSPEELRDKAVRNLEILKKEFEREKSDYVAFQLAQSYGVLKDTENTLKYFDYIIQSPTSMDIFIAHAYRYKAAIAERKGDTEQSLKFANKAMEYDDSDPILHSLFCKLYIIKKEYQKAIASAKTALHKNRNEDRSDFKIYTNEKALLLLAMQAASMGKNKKEFDFFYEFYLKNISETDTSILKLFVIVRKLLHGLEISESELDNIGVIINGANKEIIYLLIEEYPYKNSVVNLLEKFPPALKGEAKYNQILGNLYLDLGNTKNAVEYLNKAYLFNKKDPSLVFYLLSAMISSGMNNEAKKIVDEAINEFRFNNNMVVQKLEMIKTKYLR